MQLLGKVLNKFNGLHFRQEYLCLSGERLQPTLHIYLVKDGRVVKDITKHHCFVGYSPVVFALHSLNIRSSDVELVFSPSVLNQNDILLKKDAVASLQLKSIPDPFQVHDLSFFEGYHATHKFIHGFNQGVIALHNSLYGRKPGNVFLEGNLYKQVQVAYSIPRKISLITTGMNGFYNLFPTDLHGKTRDHYIISLRHEGKACRQVEQTGKIVLSEMLPPAYKKVYSLGKNHMQEMKDRKAFDFDERNSGLFDLPLPADRIGYRELELTGGFIHGIHKILLFSILNEQGLDTNNQPLMHVHNCYATWLLNRGEPGNYLLR